MPLTEKFLQEAEAAISEWKSIVIPKRMGVAAKLGSAV